MTCRKCQKELPDGALFCCWCGCEQTQAERKTRTKGNGLGSAFRYGSGYRAQLTTYEGGRRRVKTKSGFKRKKDALEWCANNNTFAEEAETMPTFSQVYREWAAGHYPTISIKKAEVYAHVYEQSEDLYPMPFDRIGVRDFQTVVNRQKNTYYARKVYRSVYSMMSAYAMRCGYITTNSAELVELPKMEKPNKRPFTADEVAAVQAYYNSTQDLFAGACLVMIYTGMRWGEISTILPENIHIQEGYLMGGIKTEAGKAGEILLVPSIRPVVQAILLPENRVANYTSEGFRKGYNRMQEAAGIEQRHTVHECRHTTATMLAHEGVQAAVISEIMRHTSYNQTMEYTHVSRDVKLAELQKISPK